MELKTLKNIESQDKFGDFVARFKLKQEAIKRAKFHINLLTSASFDHIAYGTAFFEGYQTEEDTHHIGRIAEIVEFFNLTKEEVKS